MQINRNHLSVDRFSYTSSTAEDLVCKWAENTTLQPDDKLAIRQSVMEAINNLDRQDCAFKHLDLSGYGLKTLPPSVIMGKLQGLTILDLSDNELPGSELEKLSELKILSQLHLSHNPLIQVPEQLLANMTELRVLNIDECKLSAVPDTLLNLHNLSTLNLGGNPLHSLPGTLGFHLPNLGMLDISDTNITEIPISITTLNRLILKQ